MRFFGPLKFAVRILSAHENAGVAAVEFAICATVFLTILAGTVDIGLLLYTTAELDAAVSAGAQFAENNAAMVVRNPTGLASDISSVVDSANGSGWATATVNVNNSNDSTHCYCPTGSPANWSWGNALSCVSSSTCGTNLLAGQFVTITASRNIAPLFPTFGFVKKGAVTRSAMVETQ